MRPSADPSSALLTIVAGQVRVDGIFDEPLWFSRIEGRYVSSAFIPETLVQDGHRLKLTDRLGRAFLFSNPSTADESARLLSYCEGQMRADNDRATPVGA